VSHYENITTMNDFYIYLIALFLLALSSFILTIGVYRLNIKSISKWEALPRNIIFGVTFAAIDLAWCVPQSKPIAPDFMVSWLIPIAIVCLWLSYQFLDYLFSRAFGGFLILFAHYLLYASFVFHAPMKPFISILCYFMGTVGIFFCGKPHLMRDLIRNIAKSSKWRFSATLILAIYAIVFGIAGALQFLGK